MPWNSSAAASPGLARVRMRWPESEMAAYNVVQSPYATLNAQQDSSKRAAQDMAERIHLDLGAWFRKQRK